MTKKKKSTTGTIQNRRARHDYDVRDGFLAGLVLLGWETKALRLGHGHLRGAYVTFLNGEALLTNATIMPTKGVGQNVDPIDFTRARKLLLKKRELEELQSAKKQGLAVIPLELLTKTRFIKVRISTAKGKKEYDKRDAIKKRDHEREVQRIVS